MDIETRVIYNDKGYWHFQYKKNQPKPNFLKSLISEGWFWTIPVYKTEEEAKKALKVDINRLKKWDPDIKVI
ncbi:MAG: hypothetical protein V1901_03690 [Patescibacteria group bacterium]